MDIDNTVFVVIDTETTGLDTANDEVCEIAAVATSTRNPNMGMWASLVKPSIPIPHEAKAIHHITNGMVACAPSIGEAAHMLSDFVARLGENVVFAAHNAEFDRAMMRDTIFADAPWLCTKRLAMHLWHDAPAHKNQVLRYWRNLDVETYGLPAHRALPDALVTAALLLDEITSLEFGL